jgi:hypothetical protein
VTRCMVRPCVARDFVDPGSWSRMNVFGLGLERFAPGHHGYQRADAERGDLRAEYFADCASGRRTPDSGPPTVLTWPIA